MPGLGPYRWVFWVWRRWARHSAWSTRGWQWRLEHVLVFPDDPFAPEWARTRLVQNVIEDADDVQSYE